MRSLTIRHLETKIKKIVLFQCFRPILNSGNAIAHNEKQITSAKCKDDGSCYGTITYQWLLEKCPDETSACTAVPESELTSMAETPLTSMFFSARASAYQPDTWYRLYFRAYRTPTVFAEVSSLFFVNTGPKNGKKCDKLHHIFYFNILKAISNDLQ